MERERPDRDIQMDQEANNRYNQGANNNQNIQMPLSELARMVISKRHFIEVAALQSISVLI